MFHSNVKRMHNAKHADRSLASRQSDSVSATHCGRRLSPHQQDVAGLGPEFADRAAVEVLDVGFEEAVARVRALQAQRPVDVVVAAGSNGGYLRQHLDLPIVVVEGGAALTSCKRWRAPASVLTHWVDHLTWAWPPTSISSTTCSAWACTSAAIAPKTRPEAAVRELQQEGGRGHRRLRRGRRHGRPDRPHSYLPVLDGRRA